MDDKKLNKRYVRLFSNRRVDKGVDMATRELSSVKYTDCYELLMHCKQMYDNMAGLRKQMLRGTRYTLGEQWSDVIENPDSMFHEKITEEQYIKNQGKVPLKYNIMHKANKTICGLYCKSKNEPVAIARDQEEKKIGQMMTAAMQYAYDVNYISELNVRLLDDVFCKGIYLRSCYYRYDDERGINDVYVQNENPYEFFVNDDFRDPLSRDITLIGVIRDMGIKELIATFAHSSSDAHALVAEYRPLKREDGYRSRRTLVEMDSNSEFLIPKDPTKCRVFEVWTKESEECLYCHDKAKGTEEFRSLSDETLLIEENNRRIEEMISLGYSADDASLIEYEWKVRQFWYVRYLTPQGRCIYGSESPYEHGSHPFTFGVFKLKDGKVFSPADELIDLQRVLNRTLSQIDFMRQNGAKGALSCPIDVIPEGMNPREFASQYTRSGGILFYEPKPHGQVPEIIKSQSVQAGDIDVIRLYLELNDQISGISGALKGEEAKSSTPASLYAQEAQNSANNITDFLNWFNVFTRKADTKMMKLIQQYMEKRLIPITGNNYRKESGWYTPEKIKQSEFDLQMNQGVNTPAYLANMEEFLSQTLQAGLIDLKTYLETSSAPWADNLLEIVKRKEDEMGQNAELNPQDVAQMQQILQQQQPRQQPKQQQAV